MPMHMNFHFPFLLGVGESGGGGGLMEDSPVIIAIIHQVNGLKSIYSQYLISEVKIMLFKFSPVLNHHTLRWSPWLKGYLYLLTYFLTNYFFKLVG